MSSLNLPPAESWKRIHDALSEIVAELPFGAVFPAYGKASPPHGATISRSPRIVICLGGTNIMEIPRGDQMETVTLRRGDATFVAERAWNHPLHRLRHLFLTLDFKPDFIRYYWMDYVVEDHSQSVSIGYYRLGRIGHVGGHLLRAFEAMVETEPKAEPVHDLAGLVIRETFAECTPPADERADKARLNWQFLCQFIEDHLHEPIERNDLAAHLNLHPNHISRLFRKQGQETFTGFVQRLRMERAASLLRRYDLSIKEIAHRCGFRDAAYFSNSFRRFHGMSPIAYRGRQG